MTDFSDKSLRDLDLDIQSCHLTEDVLNTNRTGHFFHKDPFDSHGDSEPS